MPYKLEVKHPDFPKDQEFDCDGILVKNNSSRELTAEDEEAFISRWGKTVEEIFGHGTVAKVTGSSAMKSTKKDGGE